VEDLGDELTLLGIRGVGLKVVVVHSQTLDHGFVLVFLDVLEIGET